jgi:hypothetical protein
MVPAGEDMVGAPSDEDAPPTPAAGGANGGAEASGDGEAGDDGDAGIDDGAPVDGYAGDVLVEGDALVGAAVAPGKGTGMAALPATEALPDAALPGETPFGSAEPAPFSRDVLPLNDMT